MKVITINCPNCNANVSYTKNNTIVNCSYCKSRIIVEDDSVNQEATKKIDNCLILANRFFADKEYDAAYKKYEQVLELNPNNSEAIFKRGLCVSLTTTYASFEIASCLNGFNNAFSFLCNSNLSYDEIKSIINIYAIDLLNVVVSLKKFAHNFYKEHLLNYDDVSDYVDRLFACLKVLDYVCGTYDLENKVKIKFDKEILKLIKEIRTDKKYADVYDIETGKPIVLTYSINKKDEKFLKKRAQKYRDELLDICVSYKKRNELLKKQRFILILIEFILICLILYILFCSNKKIWSLLLFLDAFLLLFDIFSDELLKDNILSIVIKVFIALIAIMGFCIN